MKAHQIYGCYKEDAKSKFNYPDEETIIMQMHQGSQQVFQHHYERFH